MRKILAAAAGHPSDARIGAGIGAAAGARLGGTVQEIFGVTGQPKGAAKRPAPLGCTGTIPARSDRRKPGRDDREMVRCTSPNVSSLSQRPQ